MAQIQESIRTEGVKMVWIPRTEMLADVLTKKGVNQDSILEVFKTRKLARKTEREKMG